jgi:ABC-type enterobactin transport system permease subunit
MKPASGAVALRRARIAPAHFAGRSSLGSPFAARRLAPTLVAVLMTIALAIRMTRAGALLAAARLTRALTTATTARLTCSHVNSSISAEAADDCAARSFSVTTIPRGVQDGDDLHGVGANTMHNNIRKPWHR